MKKLVGYAVVAVVSFAGGAVFGWFGRKKTSEVKFEVVDIEPGDEEEDYGLLKVPTVEETKKKIEQLFENGPAKVVDIKQTNNGIEAVLDTQKEQYFKKWKAEDAASKYDTRTKEDPENPVISEEEDLEKGLDRDFLAEAESEVNDIPQNVPEIEPAGMEDWDHWNSKRDGEYDCVTVHWFKGDGVLTDEDGDPLQNPGKFMGFDVAARFDEISEETTGDPNVRVIYNHRYKTIFQIIRDSGSYARKRGMEEFGNEYGDEEDDE